MRLAVIGLLLGAVVSGCDASGPIGTVSGADSSKIYQTESGQQLDRTDLVARLKAADIVILGEIHDNAGHHAAQAYLVGALDPSALAAEMIPRSSEEGIAVFLDQGGDRGEIGPAIGWEKLGWPEWAIYRPVFEAAKVQVITGGGLDRRVLRQAIKDGASAAAAASADPVLVRALGTTWSPAAQADVEAEMIAVHCNQLPASAAPGMVEAQRLRDASFASAALRARASTDGQVVLITGNGHARNDRGVPIYLSHLAPDLTVLSVGFVEAEAALNAQSLVQQPYDFVWAGASAAREDPCAAFQ